MKRCKPGTPIDERFWSKVQIRGQDECWEWQGLTDQKGYGTFKLDGKNVIASRMAYQLTHGNIQNGLCVCHSCDNPSCVNPRHLWLGTRLDNNRDMIAKGRARKHKGPRPGFDESGEGNPRAKLTWEQVRTIRKVCVLHDPEYGMKPLARKYGVSSRAIMFIIRGETWVESEGK